MSPPRRLRVLTLVDRPVETGGGERLARTIAMRLDPARFDRTLCATRPTPAEDLDPIRASGVRVLSLERGSRAAIHAWRPLVSHLRSARIDILHTHKFGSNVWGTVIGRLARVPVIIAHEHTWSYEGQPARRALDREVVARAAHLLLAVSREDRRRMLAVEGIDPSRVRFIPNGIAARPLADGAPVRAELGIGPNAPVIGTVGGLRPQKGLRHLIDCAAVLAGEFPDLRVLVAGDGPESGALRSHVQHHGLGESVLLLGRRSDVPEVLAAVDVAVSTSEWEGSPLAVMEYMAAARPVVATRVGGVPDLIADGVHGLLVDRGDVGGLARAVAELLRDRGRRSVMGEAGRRRQQREFDIDVMVKRLELLYVELFRATDRTRHEVPGCGSST
jgi:glycosyltransferase involved in cell wall biosynthesis